MAWARDVTDVHRGYRPELYRTVDLHDPARVPNALTAAGLAARVLVDYIHVLALGEKAGVAVDEIISAIRQARGVIDRPVPRKYVGKCEEVLEDGYVCGAELYTPQHHDTAVCPTCGTRWDVEHLLRALVDRAGDEVGTTSVIAGWLRTIGLEVSAQALRRWARAEPPLLEAVDVDRQGRALYRLKDALEAYGRRQRPGKRLAA